MQSLRASSVGFALLVVSGAAVAQIPSGGLTPDPWVEAGGYFARFVELNVWRFELRDDVNWFRDLKRSDDIRRSGDVRRSENPQRSEAPTRSEQPTRSEAPRSESPRLESPRSSGEPRRSEEPKPTEGPKPSDGVENPRVESPELEPHLTPEPSTWLLVGTGLVGFFGFVVIRSTRT